MKTLSIGKPSTLGNWYDLCELVFGPDSPATVFIKEKMDKQGRNEEVIAEENQLLFVLAKMHMYDM